MPETIDYPQHELPPPIPPESAEFLAHQQDSAERRESKNIQLNDIGAPKAAQEVLANIHAMQANETESKPLSEVEQKRFLNSVLKSTVDEIDHPTQDPFDEIEMLSKAIN